METGTNVAHDELTLTAPITQPGYIYIYLSNENEKLVDVYFDDLTIEHKLSPVMQQDDYYAFGLTFNSYSRENTTANQYLFNGIEKQDELGLGWDLAEFRAYDPSINRWLQIDPKASERESPYVGFANNPIRFADPLGDTIRVKGSEEFVKRYEQDRAKIAETKEGAALLKFLDENETDVNISEARSTIGAIKDFFSEGSGDEDHVLESKTTEEFRGQQKGFVANVEYSQIEGVEVDDSKTKSYTTLGHELSHAKDIVDGTYVNNLKTMSPADARMASETKAVDFENTLRQANGDQNYRTKYGGKTVGFVIREPKNGRAPRKK